jgi:AraC-like DNA-binding protein
MDALSELLRVIRLSGTAFIDAELSAPWAVQTPAPSAVAARLAPGAKRIIPYHVVASGFCYVQLTGERPVKLPAGRIVMFPHGDVHVLAGNPGLRALEITTDDVIRLTKPNSTANVRYGGGGARTRFICGFFACDDLLSEHLVSRLPKLISCQAGADSAASLLLKSLRPSKKGTRLGHGAALGKLSELLFVDAIRDYAESLPQRGDWLGGLKDRYVSHGLSLMYASPGAGWSLDSLAKSVGVSRSVLAEHFIRCTGMAPMRYLSQWRLHLAADALGHTDRAIKLISEEAGFTSAAAFTRAFRRAFGVSPAKWRQNRA